MPGLGAPPAAVVDRLTTEVGFDDRLIGVKRTLTTGHTSESIYSFEELLTFLHTPGSVERLLMRGGHDQIPYIDLDELVAWLRDVMRDAEAASAVALEAASDASYSDRIDAIHRILRERWEQVQGVLAPVD